MSFNLSGVNSTTVDRTESQLSGVYVCMYAVFALVGISICSLNAIVILGFIKEPEIKRVPGNVFIENLAISDCLTGMFVFYAAVLNLCRYVNEYEYLFRMGFLNGFLLASVCFLFYLTIDRYLKVTRPLRYLESVTDRKQQIVCIVTWLVSIAFGLLPLLGWHNPEVKCFSFFKTFPSSYIITTFLGGQIPTCCLVVTYTKLFLISRRHRRQIAGLGQPVAVDIKKTIQIVRSIFLLVAVYLICWLPVGFYCMVGAALGRDPNTTKVPVFTALMTFALLNSLINPLIYATRIKEIRNFVKKICCRCNM